jgi:hypothetical protein
MILKAIASNPKSSGKSNLVKMTVVDIWRIIFNILPIRFHLMDIKYQNKKNMH